MKVRNFIHRDSSNGDYIFQAQSSTGALASQPIQYCGHCSEASLYPKNLSVAIREPLQQSSRESLETQNYASALEK